ncbi:MAG: hypothetical protein HDR00_14660 [Lachnospiraceae bacterium]|nr:hypothetical protein [Lachnospiraceae bacterium]
MHIYKKIYCDEQIRPKKGKILRKIKYHGGLLNVYVITVSEGADYFDLIPGSSFRQKRYPTKDLHIMGLASGYESALSMVQQMIEDFMAQYGTCRFKKVFMDEKEMNFTGYNRKY